jgi:gentisate 1,2-dioxygenase
MRKTVDDRAALDDFMKTCSYPAYDDFVVKDVSDHPVHARAHRGNAGAYFNFKGLQALEAHISELPPGGCTKTHRHSCEALFYVLAGRGYTVVEEEGERESRIQWQAGDLFFTPMLAWHRHVNADSARPLRYLEITTLPLMKALGAWRIETASDEDTDRQSNRK